MFYDEEEIRNLIICPNCKKKLNNPRVVSCGQSICQECLTQIFKTETNGLDCPGCNDFHTMPENGFMKNQIVSNLIELEPKEIYRGKMISILKSKLEIIAEETKHLDTTYKMSMKRIKDHCDFVRHEVEIATENAHNQVNTSHRRLIKEIEDYEEKCFKQFEEKKFAIFSSDIINQSNLCINKWTNFLKRSNIDDSELDEALEETENQVKTLEKEKLKLKYKLFNGTLLKFEENLNKITSDLVGSLHFESLKLFHEKFKNLKSFNLENILKNFKNGSLLDFELLQNGNLVVAFENTNNNLSLILIDMNGNIINQKLNIIDSKENDSLLEFHHLELKSLNNTVFVYAYYLNDKIGNFNSIQSFSQNLNITKLKCNFKNIVSISTYKNRLFVLDQMGKSFESLEINVFDINMSFIQKIGQTNSKKSFYLPYSIKKIELNERYFFLFEEKSIQLMNRHDGIVLKSILICASQNFLYSEQFILSFDIESKTICSMDLDGKTVSYDEIENLPNGTRLKKISNNRFIFFFDDQLYLYLN